MTDEELIGRLRDKNCCESPSCNCDAAADRIEALVKERDEVLEELSACTGGTGGCGYWREAAKRQEARAERLEEALIWCSGSADFNEGGFAREGWLKLCAPLLKGDDYD